MTSADFSDVELTQDAAVAATTADRTLGVGQVAIDINAQTGRCTSGTFRQGNHACVVDTNALFCGNQIDLSCVHATQCFNINRNRR